MLLDTSFLISFSDPARSHHATAVKYYRECVTRSVPMYLSAIVASEFHVRQSIDDLPLRNFIVLPFNVDHAMACGLLLSNQLRDAGDDRAAVKDDCKLLAQCQCQCQGISHLISEDQKTLVKYAERARHAGLSETLVILLKSGFDPSWFNLGQHALDIPD